MPELPSQARVEVSFQNLLDNYEGYDIGLQLFDDKIRRLTDTANNDKGSFSDIIEPGVESLNEEWLYHGETATVTGRLYVTDRSVVPDLYAKWGEPHKDDQGNLSFYVEKCELRSYGVFDGPHGAPLADNLVEAKIGYGFVLPDDDSPMAQLMLYPGEAAEHRYALPTPEAIEARLHAMWPKKMAVIDTLLSADHTKIKNLPRRLAFTARHLQQELLHSSDAREWLSVHVNERLALDKVWPYVVNAQNTLFFLDDDTNQNWQEMTIDGATRLDVRKPRVEFIKNDSDGAVQAMFFAELPDTSDEWNGTPICIKATDILHLRGTRAHRSIIDRALMGHEQNFAAALIANQEEDDEDFIDDEPMAVIQPPRTEHHGGMPDFVKEMMLLRDEFESVVKMVASVSQKHYKTYDQAFEVSQALVNTVGNRLIGAGVVNYPLALEGTYALRAKTIQDGRSAEPGEIIIAVDAEKPLVELMHGDSFSGTFYAFYGDVITVSDEEGEPEHYRAVPRIIVDTKTESASGLNYGPLSLVEVVVQQRGLAALDGSVRISIPQLERYEADMKIRKTVAEKYGNQAITRQVNRLFAAFHAETDTGYQDLRNVKDIRGVAKFVERGAENDTSVFNTLSALLINRGIMAVGEAAGETDSSRFVDGIVVDVAMNVATSEETGPYVTVMDKQTGEHISLRISTIESLAF
ncbi:hypothetical protein H7142_03065 [Candidatus Saccharibacteria bacterium]|nr:hypothetical protein [Candidatus Saccharibacteria bacterium]